MDKRKTERRVRTLTRGNKAPACLNNTLSAKITMCRVVALGLELRLNRVEK